MGQTEWRMCPLPQLVDRQEVLLQCSILEGTRHHMEGSHTCKQGGFPPSSRNYLDKVGAMGITMGSVHRAAWSKAVRLSV